MSSTRHAGPDRTCTRVLHLLPHARALGGTERTVMDLLGSPALAHFDQRVAFVQPGQVNGFPSSTVLGGRAGRLLPGGGMPAILRWRPHLLHGWLLQGNLLGALLKLLLPSAALISSERHVGHDQLPGLKRQLERFVARSEDAATGNSVAVRDATIARVPERGARFRVIPPGVAAPARIGKPRRTTAVMVARVHPVKDHATALRTWRRVVAHRPDETLTIVGGGPGLAELERTAKKLELGETVRFRGEADPAPDIYGARMFLSTSRAEGFSRAVMEALAAGIPVISTDVGGMAEIHGAAVRIAPVGDDEALAAHVLEWLEHPEHLSCASTAAQGLAERFSPERCHRAHARLYAEITQRGAEPYLTQ